MSDRYFALVDPALDETVEKPGGLVRHRPGRLEVLLADGSWEDRYPALAGPILWDPDVRVEELDTATAEALIAGWPSSSLRKGFRKASTPVS